MVSLKSKWNEKYLVLKQQIWQYKFELTTSENKPDQAGEDLTNEETYSSCLNTKWSVQVWAWKLVDSMLTDMTVSSDMSQHRWLLV